jgi:Family of unknown function (DUF5677)
LTAETPDLEIIARLVRDAAVAITTQLVAYFHAGQATVNEIIIVPLLISARILRTYDAIQFLLENGYVSEATILTLTQFELRLDLAYTAHNVANASEWLDHEKLHVSIGRKMEEKINSLFADKDDRTRLGEIFKYLSGVKHGNPIYSSHGFPARGNGPELLISTGEIADEFSGEFSRQVAAYAIYQLAWSSQVINVCTGKYARIDINVRKIRHELYLNLTPVEEAFRQYLRNILLRNRGPFDLRDWKREKKPKCSYEAAAWGTSVPPSVRNDHNDVYLGPKRSNSPLVALSPVRTKKELARENKPCTYHRHRGARKTAIADRTLPVREGRWL